MGKIPVFHRRRKVDWLGGVLLMASAVVFMLVLSWGGNRFVWLSPTIMAMVGASVVLALAFVWHARNAQSRSCRCRCWAAPWCRTRWPPAAARSARCSD